MIDFEPPPLPRFYAGLDVGQGTQTTALAILEPKAPVRIRKSDEEIIWPEEDELSSQALANRSYKVRHLERWPVGTTYTKIVTDLKRRMEALAPHVALVVDITGVGRAVVREMAKASLPCRSFTITITQGQAVVTGPQGPCVPKKDLVSTLQVLLQSGRLLVSNALPDASVLAAELNTFSTRVKLGDDAACDWRERPHDDLVLAVASAAWLAENWVEPYQGPLVLSAPFGDEEEKVKKPKTRIQEILDDIGFDPNGDW
jgi:hypothetical protein